VKLGKLKAGKGAAVRNRLSSLNCLQPPEVDMTLKKYALPCLVAASLVTAGCESRYMAPLLVGSAAVIGTAALVGYAASQEKKKDPGYHACARLYDRAPVLEGYDGPYRAFFSDSPERSGDYLVSLSDASGADFEQVSNRKGVSRFWLSEVRQEDATLEDRWNNGEYNHEKHGVFCYFREDSDTVRFVIARRGR